MVELVVVIMITGILAAFVAPRFFERSVFETRGYFEQARSAIRYAQKVAIAQRRNVSVVIAGNVVSVCYDTACTAPVRDPANQTASLVAAAPSGVTIGAATFTYDGLGRPDFAAPLTLTVSGGGTPGNIVIHNETGYVQ